MKYRVGLLQKSANRGFKIELVTRESTCDSVGTLLDDLSHYNAHDDFTVKSPNDGQMRIAR